MIGRRSSNLHAYSRVTRGFSIVELATVISVILILASVAYSVTMESLSRSDDMHRATDIGIIARQLERYYRTNAVALGPTYPATSVGSTGIATIAVDRSATIAPNSEVNNVVMAATNGAQTPTVKQYIYQPLSASGALCSTAPCVRFKLYYRTEVIDSGGVKVVESMRQQ